MPPPPSAPFSHQNCTPFLLSPLPQHTTTTTRKKEEKKRRASMEKTHQETKDSSSPKTPSSTSTTSSNGSHTHQPPPLLPTTPKSVPRSDPSTTTTPYPTTFVQADPASFKQVVQMLTGSAETKNHQPPPPPPPTIATRSPIPPVKRPSFKLYERRQSSFKSLKINPLVPGLFNPSCTSSPHSPSLLDFPSLSLSSPVTTLVPNSSFSPAPASAEDRAIAEKGFFLHPSPRSADPPRLLALFPVSSSRAD